METAFSALDLARVQFAFTVSFHIVFPALSIGLASFIAVLEYRWLKTGKAYYKSLCLFWSKIFAVAFGMGVVSGVVMAYQFGTNWSGFSSFAGSVTGPLLMYEVMTAFFLEAGFLGIMLFGWNRVSPRAHFGATLMVAIGTLISTFWILASNSWMQTPQGFEIVDGQVVPTDWFAIIFNPSFPYRLAHMAIAAFVVAALVVAATAAWHLLKGRRDKAVKKMFSMSLWLLLVLAPLQAVIGDQHGINTLRHQPAKLAAIEGLWETEPGGTALNLFGIPDMKAQTTRYAVSIPHLGSLILTHSWDGEIRGLKSFPPQDRPNSTVVFWSFRIMVGGRPAEGGPPAAPRGEPPLAPAARLAVRRHAVRGERFVGVAVLHADPVDVARLLARRDLAPELARDAHRLLDLADRRHSFAMLIDDRVLDSAARMQAHRERHRVERQHVLQQRFGG